MNFKILLRNLKYLLLPKKEKNNPCKKSNMGFDAPLKIEFKNKHYYIENEQFNIDDIDTIYYGVSYLDDEKLTYYLQLKLKSEVADTMSHEGFELVNVDYIMHIMDEFNIPVLPTIVKHGVYVVKGFSLTLDYECFIHEKYLVSIYRNLLEKKNFNFNNISIQKLLEKPKKYISTSGKDEMEFNVKILSEKLTLGRGYGIYPVLNNKIIIDDIFYSFDEDEVKNKIMELFANEKNRK